VDLEKGSRFQWLVRRSRVEVLGTSFLASLGYRKSQTATEYLGIQRGLHAFLWLDYAFREVDASEGHGSVVPRTLPAYHPIERYVTRRHRNRLSPTAVGATIIRSWNGLAASLRGAFIRALTTLMVRSSEGCFSRCFHNHFVADILLSCTLLARSCAMDVNWVVGLGRVFAAASFTAWSALLFSFYSATA
jgi:hypothetical protein